jgi:hypothetical protein
MLKWDKPQSISAKGEVFTVYGDDSDITTYYVLPNAPSFRRNENGKPVFNFIKYRFPTDRPDGKKGGGFLIFDAAFTIPDDKMQAIKDAIQAQVNAQWANSGTQPPTITIGPIEYHKGTCSIQILDNGGALVQKVDSPAGPSLYGQMITPVTVELSPEGAAVVEGAMQSQGGTVQVTTTSGPG